MATATTRTGTEIVGRTYIQRTSEERAKSANHEENHNAALSTLTIAIAT